MPLPKLSNFFRKKKPRGADTAASPDLLRITFIAGVLLFFLTGSALIFFSIMGKAAAPGVSEGGFYLSLREYDRAFETAAGGAGVRADGSFDRLSRELDRLEKKAGGVDSLLSVLKRRRALARLDTRFLSVYRQSAARASAAYPHSDSLAALAAAALVRDTAINSETEAALRTYLPLLSQPRAETLRLCLHALLGDLQTPQKAADRLGNGFSPAALPYSFPGREDALINFALIKLVRAEPPAGEIQELLAETGGAVSNPSGRALSLAAEYFYDFGDPLRSAELFSRVEGDRALARQADALWLAGFPDSARGIWALLTDAPENNARALYNLALSAQSADEALPLYQKLVSLPASAENPYREYGLIHYSRGFDAPQAAALLEAENGASFPPIELELLRRQTEIWESRRSIGAVWLLVDRYPDEEDLYQWGAWYFELQRAPTETAMLLRTGARRQFHGQWMLLHEALLAAGLNDLDKAEQILVGLVSAENSGWAAPANLGRVYEARRAPARAIEYYEKAAASVEDREAASRIQLRIAHCLKTLGRPRESLRALEYALDLNPDNLGVRLELSRLK